MGHCECDKHAERSYRALFDTEGEWYTEDARKTDPDTMPDFDLLCGGSPCQAFSMAGARRGFGDPRGTLFFELARLAEARKPRYLLFENVPNLLYHDQGRTFATILNALDRLGYHVEWQVLNSKDFGVAQSRRRVYIVGFLDERCAGKILPFTTATAAPAARRLGEGFPVKEATKTGYKLAYPGDSISLAYATTNCRRGRSAPRRTPVGANELRLRAGFPAWKLPEHIPPVGMCADGNAERNAAADYQPGFRAA